MPELPEVETIRFQLAKKIVGLKITNFQINSTKIFSGDKKDLLGRKVYVVLRK